MQENQAGSYKIQREEPCRCHPETCCCGALGWHVMQGDAFYVWADTKQKAEQISKALQLASLQNTGERIGAQQ